MALLPFQLVEVGFQTHPSEEVHCLNQSLPLEVDHCLSHWGAGYHQSQNPWVQAVAVHEEDRHHLTLPLEGDFLPCPHCLLVHDHPSAQLSALSSLPSGLACKCILLLIIPSSSHLFHQAQEETSFLKVVDGFHQSHYHHLVDDCLLNRFLHQEVDYHQIRFLPEDGFHHQDK